MNIGAVHEAGMSKEQRDGAGHGAMQVPRGSERCFAFCWACQPSAGWDVSALGITGRPLVGHTGPVSRFAGSGQGPHAEQGCRCVLSALGWANRSSGLTSLYHHPPDCRAEGLRLSWSYNPSSAAHVLTCSDSCVMWARKLLSASSSSCSFATCVVQHLGASSLA